MPHRLPLPFVVLLGLVASLSACATSRPQAREATSTAEWVISAPSDRVAEAFAATRDSVGLRAVADEVGSPADGLVRLSGRSAFGRVTIELSDEGPASTRARLRMAYPLPFARETPMLHLQWAYTAAERLGAGASVANVPEQIWPSTRSTCEGLGRADVASEPGLVPPEVTVQTSPRYTSAAERAGIEGRLYLRVAIDTRGAVTCAEVTSGLPYGLNESALDAVRTWRFQPATLGGQPLAVLVTVPMGFRILNPRLPPPNTAGSVACGGTYTNDRAATCRDEAPPASTDAAGGN